MSYLKLPVYKDREREWRQRAATLEDGAERKACITLAEGYQHLVRLIEKVDTSSTGSSVVGVGRTLPGI